MAAFSCLRACVPLGTHQISRLAFRPSLISGCRLAILPASKSNTIAVRLMSGHGRTMEITPTNFEWRKFKDHMHFYFMLGLIPIGILITAVNLLIGPGELIDTPEGYEPKHWEYYKSPITQFFARYVVDSQEKYYERHLHFLAVEKEKIQLRKLEKKIKLLVGEQGKRYDSKRWYYIPSNDQTAIAGRAYYDNNEKTEAIK